MTALPIVCLLLLLSGSSQAIDENDEVAKKNLHLIIDKLDYGDWNDRIQAIHELEYMQEEGVYGLAIASEDGDWQVRMTAAHALGSTGRWGVPGLRRLLRYETCPVVRLITLHNLGSEGSTTEEQKVLGWISNASTDEINYCPDQFGPGKAKWARKRRKPWAKAEVEDTPLLWDSERATASRAEAKARRKPEVPAEPVETRPTQDSNEPVVTRDPTLPAARYSNRAVVRERMPQYSNEAVVTRDPVLPPAVKPARRPEALPNPAKFKRPIELDSLLDESTTTIVRNGVDLEMKGKSAPENLPGPVTYAAREHEVSAPGSVVKTQRAGAPDAALPTDKGKGTPENLPRPATYAAREALEVKTPGSFAKTAKEALTTTAPAAPPAKSTAAPESMPTPVTYAAREDQAPVEGEIVKDAGTGKAAHDALPALLGALKSGDVRARSRAADDLGHLGVKAVPAIPELMAALRDPAARVRSSAGLALGNIGSKHKGVVPLLIKALGDKSEDVRFAASLALARIGTPEARAAFNRHVGKNARGTIEGRDRKSR